MYKICINIPSKLILYLLYYYYIYFYLYIYCRVLLYYYYYYDEEGPRKFREIAHTMKNKKERKGKKEGEIKDEFVKYF